MAMDRFTATGTYTDNSTQDLTSSVTWTSTSIGIASISNLGLASSVNTGQTTITAALGNVTGSNTPTLTVTQGP